MTNPPLNWGYPRTWLGFMHAFTRGQYQQTNPTTDFFQFLGQAKMYVEGAADEFGVFMLLAILPFALLLKMKNRERGWMIGSFAIYICLAGLLMILLNPTTDKHGTRHDAGLLRGIARGACDVDRVWSDVVLCARCASGIFRRS